MSMHSDYLCPDKFFGDGEPWTKSSTHWAIRKLVRSLGDGGLWDFYRAVYKGTACGPTVGFFINDRWVYGDRLPGLGNGANRRERIVECRKFWLENEVHAVSVSSIVEGSDAEVPAIVLTELSENDFWEAVAEVNSEACFLWQEANIGWEEV